MPLGLEVEVVMLSSHLWLLSCLGFVNFLAFPLVLLLPFRPLLEPFPSVDQKNFFLVMNMDILLSCLKHAMEFI